MEFTYIQKQKTSFLATWGLLFLQWISDHNKHINFVEVYLINISTKLRSKIGTMVSEKKIKI